MKQRTRYALLLAAVLATAPLAAQEASSKFDFVGVSQDADIKTVGIVVFDQRPGDNPSFKCSMNGVSHASQDLNLILKGRSSIAAMLPGEYDIIANYDDNGSDGIANATIRVEAGRRYRVNCVRKRHRNIRIEVADTTPAA